MYKLFPFKKTKRQPTNPIEQSCACEANSHSAS